MINRASERLIIVAIVATLASARVALAQESTESNTQNIGTTPSDPISSENSHDLPVKLPDVVDESLTMRDLVFTRMSVDKTSVAEGEPILLAIQLWRIKSSYVVSGPYRGADNEPPALDDFEILEKETRIFGGEHEGRGYDVSEIRQVLKPRRTGTLKIGRWRWVGMAIIYRDPAPQDNVNRRLHTSPIEDKLYYRLDAGPIEVTVTSAGQVEN